MLVFVFALAALVVFLVFGFFGLRLIWWTVAAAVLLAALSALANFGPVTNLVLASVFLVLAAVLNIPILRRALITDRILGVYRRILPDRKSVV